MNLNIKISSYAFFVDSDSSWYLSEEVSCAQADVEAGLHNAAHTHLHLGFLEWLKNRGIERNGMEQNGMEGREGKNKEWNQMGWNGMEDL